MPPCDQRASSVIARPVDSEGSDECFDVVVISGESVYEVGDCGWLIWEVGDSGRQVIRFQFACIW